MPIDKRIDRRRKIVFVTPRGLLTEEDMVAYQTEYGTREDLEGFDELFDMTVVDRLDLRSPQQIINVARLSAGHAAGKPPTRMAIVATDKFHAALGQMYRGFRNEDPSSSREIEIFPSVEDALGWLRKKPVSAMGRSTKRP